MAVSKHFIQQLLLSLCIVCHASGQEGKVDILTAGFACLTALTVGGAAVAGFYHLVMLPDARQDGDCRRLELEKEQQKQNLLLARQTIDRIDKAWRTTDPHWRSLKVKFFDTSMRYTQHVINQLNTDLETLATILLTLVDPIISKDCHDVHVKLLALKQQLHESEEFQHDLTSEQHAQAEQTKRDLEQQCAIAAINNQNAATAAAIAAKDLTYQLSSSIRNLQDNQQLTNTKLDATQKALHNITDRLATDSTLPEAVNQNGQKIERVGQQVDQVRLTVNDQSTEIQKLNNKIAILSKTLSQQTPPAGTGTTTANTGTSTTTTTTGSTTTPA